VGLVQEAWEIGCGMAQRQTGDGVCDCGQVGMAGARGDATVSGTCAAILGQQTVGMLPTAMRCTGGLQVRSSSQAALKRLVGRGQDQPNNPHPHRIGGEGAVYEPRPLRLFLHPSRQRHLAR
jgi:hypothetical protein